MRAVPSAPPTATASAPASSEASSRPRGRGDLARRTDRPHSDRDPLGRERRRRVETARRIALHIVPIAAVADVELVVLGGGLGSNGDLLLEPVRRRLAEWLPYPPRVEVSNLGDAAVLSGALAVGLRAALSNVFERRVVAR